NYARSKPDMMKYAMEGFLADSHDRNPLIRALAIRTMSYIQVPAVIYALTDPLRHALKDSDPYVRKTAAICVAKLFMIDKRLVERENFVNSLRDLLADANPTVVANAVAALVEISERSDSIQLRLNASISSKWGQTYILEALMYYVPQETTDAELLAERIAIRLAHANSAVVLTTVKIILYLMNYMNDQERIDALCRKLSPPLGELADKTNVPQVLAELQEYASAVDVDFVRKSMRAIGRLAIKISSAADKCIAALLELVSTKISYVLQEAVVVIKDVFRKYPNQYEGIIGTLCEHLDALDTLEAKAAMIWIDFLRSFLDESVEVQLALLTATVKLFIKRPTVGQDLVPKVLKWATEEIDNPDLRDRGYIYWRLLSTDPVAAKDIVLGEKPAINSETETMDRTVLDKLLLHTGSLASVFHHMPETFIRNLKAKSLVDSPALNSAARSSLNASNPLSPPPVPGNLERQSSSRRTGPPLPPKRTDTSMSSFNAMGTTNGNLIGDVDLIDDPHTSAQGEAPLGRTDNGYGGNGNDPYAELQGIFGRSSLEEEEEEGSILGKSKGNGRGRDDSDSDS
ncbi:MAG: hypothetical protein CYPHOPRED_001444, partial [Cyphobasidiales sp. Tagirdzhanova-0007]